MVLSEVTKSVCHVERNLKCLKEMPRISVQNIRDFRGAFLSYKGARGDLATSTTMKEAKR